jgi:hypothetical protein
MATYNSPGVYIEEISKFPPSVVAVATAVPAFIGYTEKAADESGNDLTNMPTRITSLLEFERYYGKTAIQELIVDVTESGSDIAVLFSAGSPPEASSFPMLYYSLQLFFSNGGGPCYIVSVGKTDAPFSKDHFTDAITKLEEFDEPTLLVFPDACLGDAGKVGEIIAAALKNCKKMQDRFTIADVFDARPGKTDDIGKVTNDFRDKVVADLDELKYGAAYFPYLQTSILFHADDDSIKIGTHSGGSVDLSNKAISDAAVKTGQTAVYNAIKQFINNKATVILPPSGAVAGVYARVDNARGVWKAPANVTIAKVIGPAVNITNDLNDGLNIDPTSGKSVNAIRAFSGRGTLVWGARTLAGNDNEWRYVPVRRFFNMVEESVKKATAPFVFEPNDANTWVKVRSMIENFLTLQWRAGALAGAKPEEAFYVKVGLNQTMSAEDILNGYMIVEIGMAAVRPAEFIILRFSHKMQES